MIEELLLATNNRGKVEEIIPLLEGTVKSVICMRDLPTNVVVDETEYTFEGNAVLKAEALHRTTGMVTMADDSGLEVDYIDGAPGVFSARFAGANASDEDNNRKLLSLLQDACDHERTARFVCVIALVIDGETHTFRGTVEGRIALKSAGDQGFGYDPLFIPDGFENTFAELGVEIKKKLSHRTNALMRAVDFLREERNR